jgi:hypothetical protein
MLPSSQGAVLIALKVLLPLADWNLPVPPVYSKVPVQVFTSPSVLLSDGKPC